MLEATELQQGLVVADKWIIVATCGDSRVVLSRGGVAVPPFYPLQGLEHSWYNVSIFSCVICCCRHVHSRNAPRFLMLSTSAVCLLEY
ncbi:hypothetical protein MUK42_23876 [Musa troglodytarum]|uniref:protein-serine/threonine phosphatase n=1 Tax=Musa troglodytarum TaxID=320322 RepID=A0A9E7GGU7_9LILI|nr:hypothetical protein MUK42_23876 [Musa troglodytarum]